MPSEGTIASAIDELIVKTIVSLRLYAIHVMSKHIAEVEAAEKAARALKPKDKIIEEVRNILANKSALNGEYIDTMAQLMGALLESKIPLEWRNGRIAKVTGPNCERGAILVPLHNTNSHNYTLDVPVMLWRDAEKSDLALKETGLFGDHLDLKNRDSYRLATLPELESYFADLRVKAIASSPSERMKILENLLSVLYPEGKTTETDAILQQVSTSAKKVSVDSKRSPKLKELSR